MVRSSLSVALVAVLLMLGAYGCGAAPDCSLVPTPAGLTPRACVIEVPNGATVSTDSGTMVVTVNGTVVATYPPCPCKWKPVLGPQG